METLEYRVGGGWEPGSAAGESDDLNPSDTRDVLTRFKLQTPEQVRRAMDAAASGAAVWRATSPIDRGAVFSRAAQALRAAKTEIATIVSRENGKTIGEASVEVEKSADFLDFYAGTARMPLGTIIADARRGTRAMTLVEPVGVVLAITPWNDPMLTPARKLAPALIAGNAVVLKPARDTPLAAYHLVRALCDAGLPEGVLGTVMSDHATLDDELLSDSRLAAVSFTGSTEVGLGLQRKLAGRNVRIQTEMGGKNAAVVLADADLDLAVATIVAGAFGQAGQRCTATSRIVVETAVYDDVAKRLAAAAGGLRLGPGTDPNTQMGPGGERRTPLRRAGARGRRQEIGRACCRRRRHSGRRTTAARLLRRADRHRRRGGRNAHLARRGLRAGHCAARGQLVRRRDSSGQRFVVRTVGVDLHHQSSVGSTIRRCGRDGTGRRQPSDVRLGCASAVWRLQGLGFALQGTGARRAALLHTRQDCGNPLRLVTPIL